MSVLIATPLYPPEIGGPATHAQIVEEELQQQGKGVTVIAFADVRHLPKGIAHIAYFWKVFRAARGHHLVYALDALSVGLPALVAAKLSRKRFVVRVAGDQAWEQSVARFGVGELLDAFTTGTKRYPLYVRAMRSLESFVARHAERVVTPSAYLKKIVARWGVDRARITVVHSSYEPIQKSGNKEALRAMLGVEGALIFSAGRLVKWKGFETLIVCMHEVRERVPDARLILAGDGPEAEHLGELIEQEGLEQVVSLTGRLARDVLPRYLEAADVFALNTAYEGLSHQLLEAMDLGVPVVTTNVGGNPELIDHDTSGLLVPYNDRAALTRAIVSVLQNKKRARHLAFHASKKVTRFTRARMMDELIPLLS